MAKGLIHNLGKHPGIGGAADALAPAESSMTNTPPASLRSVWDQLGAHPADPM